MNIKISILLIIISFSIVKAQYIRSNEPYSNFGLNSTYEFINQKANFNKLPGIPNCCVGFVNGTGRGYSLNMLYGYYLQNYGIDFEFGYQNNIGTFKSIQDMLFGIEGQKVNGEFEHRLDYQIKLLNFKIAASYMILENLGINLGIVSTINIGSNFNQYEAIVIPADAVFLDDSGKSLGAIRNVKNGKIPQISNLQLGLFTGVFYDYPLNTNKSLLLRPSISYEYSLTNIVTGINWKNNSFALGIALVYSNSKYYFDPRLRISEAELQIKLENQKRLIDSTESLRNKQKAETDSLIALIEKQKEIEIKKQLEIDEQNKIIRQNEEKQRIAIGKYEADRLQAEKAVEEENRKSGVICKCYVILYISSTDKKEAERVYDFLKSNGNMNLVQSSFIEPYLKQRYYVVKSHCFDSFKEVYDERIRNIKITEKLDIVTIIKCEN